MSKAFAVQKLPTFFQQKMLAYWDINVWNLTNVSLTNDLISFEQLGSDEDIRLLKVKVTLWYSTAWYHC